MRHLIACLLFGSGLLIGCSASTGGSQNGNSGGTAGTAASGGAGGNAGTGLAGSGGTGGSAGAGAQGGVGGTSGASGGVGGAAGSGGAGGGGGGGTGGSSAGSGGTGAVAGMGGAGGMGGSGGMAGTDDPCEYPQWVPNTDYVVGDRVLRNSKGYLCAVDNPGYDPEISTSYWNPLGCTNDGTGGGGGFPGDCVLNDLLPEGPKTFSDFFDNPPWQGHVRHPVFADGYNKLCQSLIDYPGLAGFGKSGSEEQNKREIAGFFANVAQETAFLEKPVQDVGGGGAYLGRGAIQITGSAIYAEADQFLQAGIYNDPDKVGSDPILVWATGVWYWMLHSNPSVGEPSICHDAILGGYFGRTVRIIKGDCGSAQDRAGHYEGLCSTFGVDALGPDC